MLLRSRTSRPTNLWSNESLSDLPEHSSGDDDSPRRVRLRRINPGVLSLHPHRSFRKRKILMFLILITLIALVIWYIYYLKPAPFAFTTTPNLARPSSDPHTIPTGPTKRPHRDQPERDHKARTPRRKQQLKSSTTSHRSWPPLVSVVPETRPDPDKFYSGLTSSSVDAQFCNEAPQCQFLLPLWIGEQESRSRIHVVQVLQLAMALNRTLVLPNVGKSRLGACSRWDFEVYYDVGSLVGKKSPDELYPISNKQERLRKAMLMDDFKTWLELRPSKPHSQVVFVDEKPAGEKIKTKDVTLFPGVSARSETPVLDVFVDQDTLDPQDHRLKKTRCLNTKFRQMDLDAFLPVSVHLPLDEAQKALVSSDALIDALRREDVRNHSYIDSPSQEAPSPDVLILHWDIRHFPFTFYSPTNLQYSQPLLDLSDRLTSAYKPYLAVHWRMETVPSGVLPDCAESLVDTLSTLLSDTALSKGIKTIWFASDFPWVVSSSSPLAFGGYDDHDQKNLHMKIDTSARRSSTFRSVTYEHIEAIETFKNAFNQGGALEGYKLTGVAEELDRVRTEIENSHRGDVDDEDEGGAERYPWSGKGFNILEQDDDDGVLLEDPGVLGILDKLAAFNAALFVSGARGCGRVR